MVFSSSVFLYHFLPTALLLFYLTPKKGKNLMLTLLSLLFYAWGEKGVFLVLLASSLVDYSCALLIEKGKKRLGLLISVIVNLSVLGYFKYTNFAFENFNSILSFFEINSENLTNIPHVALPMGISFYTFQTMSYTIDVYRGNVKANRNFIEFVTYVSMFPQLVAGPIVRYIDIEKQLRNKNISWQNFSTGVERFIIGLAKKVLIANTFATIADDIFGQNYSDLSTLYAWVGIVAYSIQIYYDFSGYSDMAIGLGKMFGFDFLENFNFPYIARNLQDFWRRWHISLSTWFKDYLYISLGGNRKGKNRTYINLFIVFFLTGLWHGASWNFVIWGLFHGSFLVFERLGLATFLSKTPKLFQHLYTLLVVVIGWVFFRIESLDQAFSYLNKMFVFHKGDDALSSYLQFFHGNKETFFFLLVVLMTATPLLKKVDDQLKKSNLLIFRALLIVFVFIVSLIYLGAGSYNPFIYFRF